ncbi:MAG: CTP-dependent riboflavin kinase [Candidatus Diapherotrites archaeon]|uniref:Riboflavin kinase n=1 Tax=Candidatus Iainarchaeum sp. TaxID=3101447 RepID=A0A8T4LFH8_9ARCH|nr:CTP-dependent riboflavin kinase [Candidatus Diapherotrites archaeon]
MLSDRDLLLLIAAQSGLNKPLKTSTVKLSRLLGFSQQNTSRRITTLEQHGFILRKTIPGGTEISLSDKGKDELRTQFVSLVQLFDPKTPPIVGKVRQGFGEGAHYIKIYNSHLKKTLGFLAFPGTLNLEVDKEKARLFISQLTPLRVEAFTRGDRTYGGLTVYPVKIRSSIGAILIPDRTRHDLNILELVSPDYLRKKFRLSEGDSLEVNP